VTGGGACLLFALNSRNGCLTAPASISGGSNAAMTTWDVANWVRAHWFELAALALLLANLWFVFGILNVLRAINEALFFLAGRSARSGNESTRENPSAETEGGGISTPTFMQGAHPLLINVALATLSWALLVLIIVAVRALL
jgi:hypothetical protein